MDHPPVIQSQPVQAERLEPPNNPRLARMRFLSKLLDNSILLPGGYRIGLDPIIGVIPGVGDLLASTLSFWLIYDAARLGLKKRILLLMMGNVLLESLFGTVPVLGDIVDAAWKANARNMRLVENHYSNATVPRPFAKMAGFLIAALLLIWAMIFGALYLVYRFFVSLFS
jgi:hypothetical protein